MGKTKIDFAEEREKLIKQYPLTPSEAWNSEEEPLKDCPECYGSCVVPDSFDINTGKEDICPDCKGTGKVYMTEQDLADEMENEIIGNAEMMNDE